ncbi:serpin family protein, partial [candidate division KSB1 bacterium]
GMSQEDINTSYRSLIALLTNLDPDVETGIANSIWIRDGFTVKQDFIDVNQTYFDADVSILDFADPTASETINNWIYVHTGGKITDIIEDQISADIILYLINAVYFNAKWTYLFDPEKTTERPFHLNDGSEKYVPFMYRKGYFNAYENEDFRAVDLPYGTGNFCMTIMMPSGAVSIDEFILNLDMSDWNQWMNGFTEAEDAVLYLPKFKMDYDIELKNVLSAMGMGIAFSASADFTRINEAGGIWIDKVKHNTFIDVNEEGTEAAAATVVSMIRGIVEYDIDRPFLFFIRERATGSILFAGKMLDPEY